MRLQTHNRSRLRMTRDALKRAPTFPKLVVVSMSAVIIAACSCCC